MGDIRQETFTPELSMIKHRETVHNGRKDYACDKCEKKFGEKSKLIRHQRTVQEGSKDYACNKCEKKFGVQSNLLVHQRTVHEGIFRKSEIERLLGDSLYVFNIESNHDCGGRQFIEFLAEIGYKDEPTVDKDGKPLLNRSTAVHFAACNEKFYYIGELFKIYDKFDLNYCNEFGLTHFHAACMAGCHGVVEKFLELGQDPNCMAQISSLVPPPLHYALKYEHRRVIELLLRNGADPNLADTIGVAPLHVICNHCHYADEFAKILFKISDETGQTVRVDARDTQGQTALQLAVTSLLPDLVDVLLDRGANMSKIVFPTKSNSEKKFLEEDKYPHYYTLRRVSAIMLIVERFEKKGHEFGPSDALRIRKFFVNEGLFKKAVFNLAKFAEEVKHLNIGDEDSSPKLYDAICRQPQEAINLVTYSDCFDFARSRKLWSFSVEFREPCAWHLCEIIEKKFHAWHRTVASLHRYMAHIFICKSASIKSQFNNNIWTILATIPQPLPDTRPPQILAIPPPAPLRRLESEAACGYLLLIFGICMMTNFFFFFICMSRMQECPIDADAPSPPKRRRSSKGPSPSPPPPPPPLPQLLRYAQQRHHRHRHH
ncbi:unnamed protein product [Trichogramma brassicae]|uniref:C2H2-type domain-containing protein n=1 Tax=Trichogramma brassicae TaxID=86971 RepID=A0A6H5J7R2_9HYME|nr:unnamed protein product [Trichogramma brassicae]